MADGGTTRANSYVAIRTLNTTTVGGSYYDNSTSTVNNITNHNYVTTPSRAQAPVASREAILSWLNAPSFYDVYRSALEQRIGQTGSWFLKTPKYRYWVETKGQMLWISGIPGSGKTVLAAIIVDHLEASSREREDVGIAFAFLRYTEAQSGVAILASLLSQLVGTRNRALPHIQPAYSQYSHMGGSRRPVLQDICAVLANITASFSRVYTIVDGFDEAGDPVKKQLLQSLPHLGVNLLILSRPLPLFRLDAAAEIQLMAHTEDIELYITERIRLDPRLSKMLQMRPDAEPRLRVAIQTKSEGMFLLAKLQMDEIISSSNNIHGLFRALNQLPSGIQEMYQLTMDRIGRQPPDDVQVAYRVLNLLLQIAREDGRQSNQARQYRFPPSTRDIQYAIATNVEYQTLDHDQLTDISLILSTCCGLVIEADASDITTQEQYKTLRFIHYTTQGYLEHVKRVCMHSLPLPDLLELVATISKGNSSALEPAIYARKWDTLQELVRREGAIDERLSSGKMALEVVTEAQDWDGVQAVVALGANLVPGLRILAQNQNWQGLRFMIELGNRYNSNSKAVTSGWNYISTFIQLGIDKSFSVAASAQNWQNMAILIELGADVDLCLQDGTRALEVVFLAELWDLVSELVNAGADVNTPFKDGNPALYTACEMGSPQAVIELLVEKGADMNAREAGRQNWTSLHQECENGRDEIVQLLLDHGADPTLKGYAEWTPLHIACDNGKPKCAEILLKHVKNPADLANAKDISGETPLHLAYQKGHQDCVKLLLANGADDTIRNIWGKTPPQLAPKGFKLDP